MGSLILETLEIILNLADVQRIHDRHNNDSNGIWQSIRWGSRFSRIVRRQMSLMTKA